MGTITYLAMTSPADLVGKEVTDPRFQVVEARVPQWPFNRFLYVLVGHDWHWRDRLVWTDQQWAEFAESPALRTFVAWYDGSPAGYFELRCGQSEVEIASFGLAPKFIGRGLGGPLLTIACREAWRLAPERVCLNTCTLDHPAALPNYLARGFRVVRTETH